jgi:hypothetical protein
MRNHRQYCAESAMATTGSDGIPAHNMRFHLCGVQINQFVAATKTYDGNAITESATLRTTLSTYHAGATFGAERRTRYPLKSSSLSLSGYRGW